MEENNAEEDENQFPSEEIDRLMTETAEEVLKEAMWDEKEVPHWVNRICEEGLEKLVKMQRPYKFVITCLMQQKTGSVACHSSYSCFFENATDGIVFVIYPP
jgi:dynein light chain Tctex-type 1